MITKPSIFVGDCDDSFLKEMASASNDILVITANTQRDCQLALANKDQRFSAICINQNLAEPNGLPVIRFVKAHRPATPLYLIEDPEVAPFPAEQIAPLHIQEVIKKPIAGKDLIQKIFPSSSFELDKLLSLSKENTMKAGEAADLAEDTMHPIKATNFISGKVSFFDVYVKIGANKFLMILKSRDQMDFERIKSYLKKGVTHFYIKTDAQAYYLQYCDKMTEALLKSDKVPIEMKQSHVMNLGKETLDHLRNVGLSEISIQSAQKFVNHAQSLVSKHHLYEINFVDKFMKNLKLADHGAGTVMVLSMLLEALDFKDEKVVSTIALGGLFHDIGLLEMPEKFQMEDPSLLSPEELIEFEKHPQIGHDILLKVPHVNPLLPQVVLQHHERRSRKGFPLKLGAGAISPVAEMIALADMFTHLIKKAEKDKAIKPLEEIEIQSKEFSAHILEGFRKAFNLK